VGHLAVAVSGCTFATISLQGGALQGEGLFPDSERPGATIPRHLFKQAVARKTRTLE